jgi:Caspase domain
MEKVHSRSFVLLIGVDDYSAFDPTHSKNLPGSVNDVEAWFRFCVRRGIPRENIRVLASPAPGADIAGLHALAEARTATKVHIQAGLAWLADELARPGSYGLITFSGHGAYAGTTAVVCPSDTDRAFVHTIPVDDLVRRFGANLTAVIDSCHADIHIDKLLIGGGAGARVSLALSAPPPVDSGVPPFKGFPLAARVFTATPPFGTAVQAEFEGRFQGAFSWALTSTLGQWAVGTADGAPYVTASCQTALDFSKQILAALVLPSMPQLHGKDVANLPFFGPNGATSSGPNGPRLSEQIPPDVKVHVTCITPDGQQTAESAVISVGAQPQLQSMRSYTEYWSLTADVLGALNAPSPGAQLVMKTESPIPWRSLGVPVANAVGGMFSMPIFVSWVGGAPHGQAFFSSFTDETGAPAFSGFVSQLVAPTRTTPWSGTVTWYLATRDPNANLALSKSGQTFTFGDAPALPAGYSWRTVQLAPAPV